MIEWIGYKLDYIITDIYVTIVIIWAFNAFKILSYELMPVIMNAGIDELSHQYTQWWDLKFLRTGSIIYSESRVSKRFQAEHPNPNIDTRVKDSKFNHNEIYKTPDCTLITFSP